MNSLDCDFQLDEVTGLWVCADCNTTYPVPRDKRPKRNCTAKQKRQEPTALQPGTVLHAIIKDRIGADSKKTCQCNEKITLMNLWGSAGCRENLDWIVSSLLGEARKRKWAINGRPLLTTMARLADVTPLGQMFARNYLRKMVLEAIETCENQPTG